MFKQIVVVSALVALALAQENEYICEAPVDLILAFDGSGSISSTQYERFREFAIEISEKFLISESAGHLGVIQFAHAAHLELPLESDASKVKDFLENQLTQRNGNTNVHDGMLMAQEHFADKGRPNRAHFLVVLTDGKPTVGGDPGPVATLMKTVEQNTTILGVGIDMDPTPEANMRTWVTPPDSRFYIDVANFDALQDTITDILGDACIACPLTCCGHGYCNPSGVPPCVCDAGYTGEDCCDIEADWLVPVAIAATSLVGLAALAFVLYNASTQGLGALPVPIEEIEVEELEAIAIPTAAVMPAELDLDADTAGMMAPPTGAAAPMYGPASRVNPTNLGGGTKNVNHNQFIGGGN